MDQKKEKDAQTNPQEAKNESMKKHKTIKIKESEYANLIKELAQAKDKYLRIYAEFENARKRMEREKLEFVKYANEGLISEFLHVMDDLERSVEAAKAKHQDYEGFLKGIEMVMKHINEMLSRNGVKLMDAKGKKFDPHYHEVMMQEETKDAEDGTVLDVFQKGYLLGDRVVRTAKVKLAKNVGEAPAQDSIDESEDLEASQENQEEINN